MKIGLRRNFLTIRRKSKVFLIGLVQSQVAKATYNNTLKSALAARGQAYKEAKAHASANRAGI